MLEGGKRALGALQGVGDIAFLVRGTDEHIVPGVQIHAPLHRFRTEIVGLLPGWVVIHQYQGHLRGTRLAQCETVGGGLLIQRGAYVANSGSDSISIIDLDARRETAEIPVGDRPTSIIASPDGRYLALTESGADTLRFLDPDTGDTLSLWGTADRP